MKLLFQGVFIGALLISSGEARKRKRKVYVKKDTRKNTENWDQSKYNAHWQTLGACGVPMVAASDDIVSGIPKSAFAALEEITVPDNYVSSINTKSGDGPGPKGSGRASFTKSKNSKTIGKEGDIIYKIVPKVDSSFASAVNQMIRGHMRGSKNVVYAKTEEAKNNVKKLLEMSPDKVWEGGFSNRFKKKVYSNGAKDGRGVRPQTAKDIIEGASNQLLRVVGGRDSKPDTWPWQVHLTICGKWYGYIECNVCGASILNPVWLLTAAHCVPQSPSGYTIYGTNNIASKDALRAALYNWRVHDNWNPNNFDNDVALVQPKKVIEIGKSASPICLPTPDTCWDQHTACVVTGWGLTGEKNTIFPDHLQEVAVRLIDNDVCKSRFKNYHILTDNMLCAGYSEGQRDACAGDSGGPLVCKLPGMNGWVLHGTVSWGYGCARQNAPGVYADVKKMIPWINRITKLMPDENLSISKKAFSAENINENTGCFRTSAASETSWYSRDITEIISAWKNKVSDSMSLWQHQVNKTWVSVGGTSSNSPLKQDQSSASGQKNMVEEVSTFDSSSCNPIAANLNVMGKNVKAKGASSNTLTTDLSPSQMTSQYGLTDDEAAAATQSGVITSANWPKPHPAKAECEYVIQNTNPDKKVALTVTNVKLDCRAKVYVYIINGDTKKTVKLCRMKRPMKYTSAVGFVISFLSDVPKERYQGFKIEYNYLSSTHVCNTPAYNKMKEGHKVKLATEGWPKGYSVDSQCRWSLQFPQKEGYFGNVALEFTKGVKTERGIACGPENDNFIIFEASDCSDNTLMKAEIWGSLCGWSPARQTHKFMSEKGICVVFIADGDKKKSKGAEFIASMTYVSKESQGAYNKPRLG